MKDQSLADINLLDVLDKLTAHQAALDYLTNSAPEGLAAVLYLLEKEMAETVHMVECLLTFDAVITAEESAAQLS